MICHIPCIDGIDLLKCAVNGLYNQVSSFFLINNTGHLLNLPDPDNKIYVENMRTPQVYEQSLNVAIRHARESHEPCLWAHNDIIVQPGAVDALIKKYEEVKNTKWGVIWSSYDSLCLFNTDFFYNENIWGDPWLFQNYYGDNHRYRLMQLRGYTLYECNEAKSLVTHLGSMTIKQNAQYNRKNGITFDKAGQIYASIWGGLPGQERVTDPTAGGLYPL